jgi:hypothetical protein
MMAVKVLSAAAAAAVTRWSRSASSELGARASMVDTLYGDGVRADDCFAPKGGSREFYDSLQAAVVAGFSKDRQALLATDTESLSDNMKALKRVVAQSIGKYLGNIRDGLSRLEKAEEKAKAEAAIREAAEAAGQDADEAVKAANKAAKARWEDKARKTLATLIDQASSREGLVINDQSKFLTELKSAMARLK